MSIPADTLVDIPSWGSASVIELSWMITGFVIMLVTLLGIADVYRDFVLTVHGSQSEALRLVARSHIRREVLRHCQGIVIMVIGLLASIEEDPTHGHVKVSILGLVLTVGLFMMAILIALQSWLDHRLREQLREKVR